MAKRFSRRRWRRRTEWFPPPLALSHQNEGIQPVRPVDLERLVYAGGPSLTWAATPEALTDVQESDSSATAKSLVDDSTLNTKTRVLRVVGHFRPVAAYATLAINQEQHINAAEVRYGIVRVDRPGELANFDAGGVVPQQPDLFNGFHLASERIALLHSFVLALPTDANVSIPDIVGLNSAVLYATQWWNNPALGYLDWKSNRLENEDSGMYLLRQLRLTGEAIPDVVFTECELYDLSYARVLRAAPR